MQHSLATQSRIRGLQLGPGFDAVMNYDRLSQEPLVTNQALISAFSNIQLLPQRKLERELVQYGGAPTATGSEPDECDDEHEQHDGVDEPIASVSGAVDFQNIFGVSNHFHVIDETVVEPIKAQGVGGHMPSLNTSLGFHTLVFTHQYLPWTFLMKGTTMYDNGDTKVIVTTSEISREEENHLTEKTQGAAPPAIVGSKKKHNVPVSKKKAFKRVVRHRSQPKLQRKRDKKKGGKKNKKIH
ncbi:hypothetical protein CK203_014261 [Vitis vinifera]|uniref:Uncharacterized protein n=1 Tax=Vitis vinifera TaxID=29760 RepID=A0A438JHI8_VITVI|nr:hypothetical protein CK203_014261 [Vitis vinifera]